MPHVPPDEPITDLATLLASMRPTLHDGTFVFATLTGTQPVPLPDLVALVREPEGVSVIVTEDTAQRHGLTAQFRCAWITLTVHSALQAVGLTAAVATALGNADIPCNVVAGTHHDHLFVPLHMAPRALQVLDALQQRHQSASHG